MSSSASLASVPSAPTTSPTGPAGPQADLKLTPKEVEALRIVKQNMDRYTKIGSFVGLTASYLMMKRWRPQASFFRKAGVSLLGGFAGSAVFMPLGVFFSSSVIKQVEDPNHLMRVMVAARNKRKGLDPNVGASAPPPPNLETGWQDNDYHPQTKNDYVFGRDIDPVKDEYLNRPRADPFSSSVKVSVPLSSSTKVDPTTAAMTGQAKKHSSEDTSSSRWAQIRGDKEVEPSKWETIRQQNAKQAYRSQQNGNRSDFGNESEAKLSLSGGADDPGWSSNQSGGWSENEFLPEPDAGSKQTRRNYPILAVDEDKQNMSWFQVKSDAPLQVAKGSLLAAAAGAAIGSSYGVMKGKAGLGSVFATRMALNMFAFAFPFFAFREYLIRPTILALSLDEPERLAVMNTPIREVGNPHTRDVAASGLSGALAGGGMAAFARGPRSIPSGIIAFGAACTGLQFIGNELRWTGRYLLTPHSGPVPGPRTSPLPTSHDPSLGEQTLDSLQAGVDSMVDETNETFQAGKETLSETGNKLEQKTEATKSWWSEKLKSWTPVRSISDEEYEQKLVKRLEGVEEHMAQVKAELERLEAEENQA